MAIRICTKTAEGALTSKSHWWGFPDLPEGTDFPTMPDDANKENGEGED